MLLAKHTPYRGIPDGYEAHLSCEYHSHQVLSYSTPSQSSGTKNKEHSLIRYNILEYPIAQIKSQYLIMHI